MAVLCVCLLPLCNGLCSRAERTLGSSTSDVDRAGGGRRSSCTSVKQPKLLSQKLVFSVLQEVAAFLQQKLAGDPALQDWVQQIFGLALAQYEA